MCVALDDGQDHRQAAPVETLGLPAGRRGDPVDHQGLDLDEQGPMAVEEGGDHRAEQAGLGQEVEW